MRQATFRFIFITVLLDVLAIGLIIPVLPKLIESFVGGDTSSAASWVGLFATVFALMQFFGAPVLGVLSDQYGRRPVILLSCLGLGLDYVLMAVSPTLAWLFLGRLISGLTSSSFATANAYIADVTPPEQRAGSFGMLGAAWGVGFVLGPALGGFLGDVDPRLPFWCSAGFALVNFAYGLFVLPESLPQDRRRPFAWKRANPLGALKLLRSHHELWGLAVVNLLSWTAHSALPAVFVLYTGHRYGWTPKLVGGTLALVGVANMIVQGGLVRKVIPRIGERNAVLFGLGCGVVMFLIYGLAPTSGVFLIGIPFGALMGFAGPAIASLMSKRVSASEQGELQGANASIMGFSGLYSPGMFSLVFSAAIGGYAHWHLPGAAYVLAACLTFAALLQAWRTTRPTPIN